MKNISPPVFYYHSVAPEPIEQWVLHFLTLRLQNFEHQMAYLKRNNYKALFMDEWLAIRRGIKSSDGSELCLTFDDGLLDNWVYAYPVAKKYGMRFTLFVSPECIEPNAVVRPNLEDVWSGKCSESDLEGLGYLSWEELKLMQESGVVDVQSHTMTHAKYVVSEKIKGFYYGGFKGLHPILNAHPEIRATYMKDAAFEQRLSFGTPLFEEQSAVIAKKHRINPDFFSEAADIAAAYDLSGTADRPVYEVAVRHLADRFVHAGNLHLEIESDQAFRDRLRYEVVHSKKTIEEHLGKPVHFLCWPHGDNTMAAHVLAKESGYHATTSGKMTKEAVQQDRIPRIGADFNQQGWLSRLKLHYKIASHYRRQPYRSLFALNEFKNKILN
jgi:peptidoglycan/xylan/chitin deacetylase (PgdA/CDA1 family)